MRILHYHRNIRLERGGVVRFVLDVCAAMAARGHEVTLLSPDTLDVPRDWMEGERKPGLPRAVRSAVPHGPLGLWKSVDRRDVEGLVNRAEVVHVHGAWMPSNVQVGRMCERAGVPYVVSPHGMLDDWCTAQSPLRKRIYHAAVGARLFERAAVVHCTAQAELDQSRKWFPGKRADVVPLLVDTRPFVVLPGAEEARAAFAPAMAGAPVVLFLSRLHPKKGVEALIDAVALLKAKGVACNLLVAGTGEREYAASLEQRAAERDIADRTRLVGMVTGRLKTSLFQLADVFALPTSQENFGLAIVEAMACGAPAVTTRGVDIWPELEASAGAVLAEPTAEAFAHAIGGLLADAGARARMSAAARVWVLKELDPENVTARYEAMYERAMSEAGSGVSGVGTSAP